MAFTIKQHDTRPAYTANLTVQTTGSPGAMDLTNATTVLFKMRKSGTTGTPKVSAAMTITNPTTGGVSHTWIAADTDTAGSYDVEFEITWNDGGVQTVPNDSYNSVVVKDDLDT